MNLYDHRQKIIDDMRAALPSNVVRRVEGHRGQFSSLNEIKKLAVKSPAVLVAYTGFKKVDTEYGSIDADVDWVAFILAQDRGRTKRDEIASIVANGLLEVIRDHRRSWGAKEKGAVSGRNITSLAIDKAGMSVWLVRWTRKMELSEVNLSELVHWEGWDAKHISDGLDMEGVDYGTALDADVMMETEVDHPQE